EATGVPRHPHRQIAGPVRVQVVTGAGGRTVREELSLEAAALRIERRAIEIDDGVEQSAGADEVVEGSALLILLRKAVRRVRRAERRNDGGPEYPDVRAARPNVGDHVFHGALHGLEGRIAVLAEIVDAFEPDQGRDARQIEHVAIDALPRRRAARKWLMEAVFRRPGDLVAADAGIDHRDAVAVKRVEAPRQDV